MNATLSFKKQMRYQLRSGYPVPEELQAVLNGHAVVKAAFAALTPGRRKSYSFRVSGAKQVATRHAQAERLCAQDYERAGFNELSR